MDSLEQKIIDYCDDQMEGQELRKFELALASDLNLQHRVKQHQELILAVKSDQLRRSMADIMHRSEQHKKSKRRLPLSMIIGLAAAVTLLVIAVTQFLPNEKQNQEQILSQLFYKDAGLPTVMGEVEAYQFYDGMVDYKQNNYDKALDKWYMLDDTIGQDTLSYYRAMAYLQLGEAKTASLELLKVDRNSPLYQKSLHYLLQAYILADDRESAVSLFQALAQTDDKYDDLKSLINQLKD